MNDTSTEARIVALESRVAINQKTIDELNDEVVRQGAEIDKLKAEVEVRGRQILRDTEGEAEPHIKAGRPCRRIRFA